MRDEKQTRLYTHSISVLKHIEIQHTNKGKETVHYMVFYGVLSIFLVIPKTVFFFLHQNICFMPITPDFSCYVKLSINADPELA